MMLISVINRLLTGKVIHVEGFKAMQVKGVWFINNHPHGVAFFFLGDAFSLTAINRPDDSWTDFWIFSAYGAPLWELDASAPTVDPGKVFFGGWSFGAGVKMALWPLATASGTLQ